MKKCSNCNVEMVEGIEIHTDYVGGFNFKTQIYVDYKNDTEQVKSRVCPKCGNVELYIDFQREG